jgi:hypothetical protein
MKKKLALRLAAAAVLLVGLVLGLAHAQEDDEKPKKTTYHLTVYVAGLNDTIELDDVDEKKIDAGEVRFVSGNGSKLIVPRDKVLAILLEPMSLKKRAQDDKQPK